MEIVQQAEGKTKQCSCCRAHKPTSEFRPEAKRKDGFYPYCYECNRAKSNAAYAREKHTAPKVAEKQCRRCGVLKQAEAFYRKSNNATGLTSNCIDCIADVNATRAEKRRENSARWKKENAAENKDKRYKWRYGITIAERDAMIEACGGICEICKQAPVGRTLYVDHDHLSGKVRGMLCINCNSALGQLGDSIELLKLAIAYLEKHKEP